MQKSTHLTVNAAADRFREQTLGGSCALCSRPGHYAPSPLPHTVIIRLKNLHIQNSSPCNFCHVVIRGVRHFAPMFHEDLSDISIRFDTGEVNAFSGRREGEKLAKHIDFFFGEKIASTEPPPEFMWLDASVSIANLCSEVKRGIEDCRSHPECVKDNEGTVLPSRLLHIAPGGPVTLRHIPKQQDRPNYAALSHCWGSLPGLRTTTDTLKQHEHGIAWASLPKTFQDAVIFTHFLGLEYIWIDSLCIIQDSAADWEAESSRMGLIYAGAEITIAASKAPDGSAGLFTDRSKTPYIWRRGGLSLDVSPQYRTGGADSRHPTYKSISHQDMWSPHAITTEAGYKFWIALEPTHEIFEHRRRRPPIDIVGLGMPLFTRAWYLQERLMSRRVVHFGAMELYMECNRRMSCECGGDIRSYGSYSELTARKLFSQLYHDKTKRLEDGVQQSSTEPHDNTGHAWHKLIEEYTRLRLTHETDRLPALSGIANTLAGTYLAGLLTDSFPSCLYWTINTTCNIFCRRPFNYRAPTFSWASIEGPIDYHEWPRDIAPISQSHPRQVFAQLIGADAAVQGLDPKGRVVSGHMRIQAYCGSATVHSIRCDGIDTWCDLSKGDTLQSFALDVPLCLAQAQPTEVIQGDTVTLALLECAKRGDVYQCAALVLKQVDVNSGDYRRVGLIGPNGVPLDKHRSLYTYPPIWFEAKREIRMV